MTSAPINDLFEEGITRSRALGDAADEALRGIDEMAQEAAQAAERIEAETGEARQHIRELRARLERAESALDASGHEAETALSGLADRSTELAAEAASLLDRVKSSLAELDARHDRVEQDLDARMETAQHDGTGLADQTAAAQGSVHAALEQAAQALATLRHTVDTERGEHAQKHETWSGAAEALASGAAHQAAAWASGLMDLLERQSTLLTAAANAMVEEHNTAMEAVRERFVRQAPHELVEALAPLEAGLGELGQVAGTCEQILTAETGRLQDWAEAAIPLTAGVKDALAAAAAGTE
ncbi:MAG: hypothetical protein ABW221_07330 [Vicinamibacteria bacterium]